MLSRIVSSSFFGISLADRTVDQIAKPRRFLDARAGLGAHVQLELAGVAGREEILAEPRQQAAKPSKQTNRNTGTKQLRR